MLEIVQIPVLQDNYIWLAHTQDKYTAVIDPAESQPVLQELKERNWKLTHILNTHHHPDHIGANLELKEITGCTIVGSKSDYKRIPGIEVKVSDGDKFKLGKVNCYVYELPGHTRGHIAFHFNLSNALFCGDTLFSLGCGRVFEGTMQQMLNSLSKIKKLPHNTKIYCAHEYTQANGFFALTIDPKNKELISQMEIVKEKRKKNISTIPSILGNEIKTNPFLRTDNSEIKKNLKLLTTSTAVETFSVMRKLKDNFTYENN